MRLMLACIIASSEPSEGSKVGALPGAAQREGSKNICSRHLRSSNQEFPHHSFVFLPSSLLFHFLLPLGSEFIQEERSCVGKKNELHILNSLLDRTFIPLVSLRLNLNSFFPSGWIKVCPSAS